MHLSFLLEPNIVLGWIPTIHVQATGGVDFNNPRPGDGRGPLR